MRGRPPGSLVSLYYDSPRRVEEGDVIQTPSGKRYRVESRRVQARGKHVGRQHFMATVLADDEPNPEGAVVHPIYWYDRSRSRACSS